MFASVGYAPGGAVMVCRGIGRRTQPRGEDKVTSFSSSNFFQNQRPGKGSSAAVHDNVFPLRALLGNGGGVHRRLVACAAEGGGGGGKPSSGGAAGDALAGRMAKAKKYKEAAGTGTDGYAKATAAAEVDINLARAAEGGGGGDKPSGGRTREAFSKTSRKKYTGVTLEKKTGRWKAQCQIGDKHTYLGIFGSEEEAARTWDRMRLWSCKANGKKKEEVKLNFPLSEYNDDEVTALQALTQEEMILKLRRTGQEERVASQASRYKGVASEKSTGRWRAQCTIGGKTTYLGIFDSEEEAARARDRERLWLCKGDGEKKAELKLNFLLSEYNDDEVTALQGLTLEEMLKKSRRAGKAV
jgi:hypothetical protein